MRDATAGTAAPTQTAEDPAAGVGACDPVLAPASHETNGNVDMGLAESQPHSRDRWWSLTSDPDVRLFQVLFTLLLGQNLALRFGSGSADFSWGSWPGFALTLALVLCAAAFVAPRLGLPLFLLWWALPVLDMAALGLSRLGPGPGAGSASVLVVLPALWLGRRFGSSGVWLAGLSAALLVSVPGLVHDGFSPAGLSRDGLSGTVLVPVVATWAAFAVAAALAHVRRASEEAAERGRELATALETIKEQRRFANAILDTVDVGLILLDPDGTYRTMNRRHEAFMRLGYPDGHAGRAGQLGDVFGEDGVTALTREEMPTHRASLGEEFDDFRLWIGRDQLTNRAISVSARSVRDEHGAFSGAALAYTDVTDYMRALQIKDEFVASVSHELRTPLTSIVGYVDILQDRGDLPEVVRKQLGVMARNTQRLQRLVADLLHTAQADGAPMHVSRTRTDLARIARDAVEAATPTAETAGIVIEAELPDALELMVDAQRMAQVVDNLISNAIKYSPAGGRIRVSLTVDGDRVELAIADTGIGIEAADRDRLFTRFFRARDVQETTIQGVGLGLSIARAIVESHGGRIEVDSEVGKGSVFRVRLPHVPR